MTNPAHETAPWRPVQNETALLPQTNQASPKKKSWPLGRFLGWAAGLVVGLALIVAAWPVLAQECPSKQSVLPPPNPALNRAFNPNPSEADLSLPLPCGGQLVLRHVCVPADGFFGDVQLYLGCQDCQRWDQSFMESKRKAALSGPFTLEDLPQAWRRKLTDLAARGDGRCPRPDDQTAQGFYYFIGRYEVTNFQWQAVMEGQCPGQDQPLTADDPRPKTNISWFEAVDFTRRYTEWLLENAPDSMPKFAGGRPSYLRLPTEAEWEYAARGGHKVTESQMNQGQFFPLKGRPYGDYAVFTEQSAAKPPQKLAWIGSKCANPLGLHDTAGNAAEMVLDPFRFSIGFRLHGARGGFVIKGGSFRKRKAEIMPGRREEMPFFLENGAFRRSDLGFRVVLSAIITPKNRIEALKQEWARAGRQRTQAQTGAGSLPLTSTLGQGQDPIAQIDRLVSDSSDDSQRRDLLSLREIIKQSSIVLTEQTAETIKGILRSTLFIAESVLNYAIRRKTVISWLNRVESIEKENLVPSDRQWLEEQIVKEKENVEIFEMTIDNYLQFHLDRIRELGKYPEAAVDSQLIRISDELSLDDPFGRSLKKRFEALKKHLAMDKSGVETLTKEVAKRDIISETAP
ncbi:MAG: SUMF1/EgtB/PvdO family nonheme iron enzyme [Deltaproteobacteria bacterium]|nr:SUMF1/EgtB/PvdO family nonheme iron enzyme [Deltaproteobacteria bacterium]